MDCIAFPDAHGSDVRKSESKSVTLGFFPVSKLARCPVGYGQDPSAVGVPMHTSDEGCDLNGMAKTSPRVQFIWIPPIISRLSITALAGYFATTLPGVLFMAWTTMRCWEKCAQLPKLPSDPGHRCPAIHLCLGSRYASPAMSLLHHQCLLF